MKHISKFFLFVSTIVFSLNLFTFQPVDAQDIKDALNGKDTSQTQAGILSDVQRVINFITAIAAAIAVAVIVYGAGIWIVQGQENGQKIVINATIGIIVLVLSYFIAQLAVGLANSISRSV